MVIRESSTSSPTCIRVGQEGLGHATSCKVRSKGETHRNKWSWSYKVKGEYRWGYNTRVHYWVKNQNIHGKVLRTDQSDVKQPQFRRITHWKILLLLPWITFLKAQVQISNTAIWKTKSTELKKTIFKRRIYKKFSWK